LEENASQGTFLVEASIPVIDTSANSYIFQLDDGGTTDRIRIFVPASTTYPQGDTINSGGDDGSSYVGAVSDGTAFKTILAYAQDDVVLGVDGTLDASPDETADLPLTDTLTTFRIGHFSTAIYKLNGNIARITYWPRRLPDIALQNLTAR
jgi:hypothetical protein